jgi:hypothetical protein
MATENLTIKETPLYTLYALFFKYFAFKPIHILQDEENITTRCHNPEDHDFNLYRCETLKKKKGI